MKTRNGSERATTHHRRRSRLHEAKSTRSHHKKTPIDQSNFAEMSAIVMKYLERALAGSNKRLINSHLLSKMMGVYLRRYPLVALGSAAAVGSVLSLLITHSDKLGLSDSHHKYDFMGNIKDKLMGTADDSMNVVSDALEFLVSQIKDHSIELYDELIDNFLKKYPLQTTAGALALGVLLTLIIRR